VSLSSRKAVTTAVRNCYTCYVASVTVHQLPLCAYVRVSTASQAASGIGLDAQRHAIIAAASLGTFEVGEWYEDAGKSGASMRNRPGLSAALDSLQRGEAGGLVCAKIDRLGRSTHDVSGLVERAVREGWRLVALDVGLDTTTPAGEMVATALMMAARFEYRRISERQLEKHRELRRLGRPRGRPAASAEVAELIAERRQDGWSYRRIAALLNSEGVPTAQGAATWGPASVRSAQVTRAKELDMTAQCEPPTVSR
jgi:DNA invertase Pin-like site-specific DNA recombinase